ncbi:hypothetical protein QC762_600200 [Podospora pseudocomata]|uniref:Apple domain-containing protein n=1 Tax=Podospora pseudocomata TaxID=2093779 RepID=A0ABR0G827_9PEZI|nr:hypothetical protein QC762_600200 [Podospora pseudocomata]
MIDHTHITMSPSHSLQRTKILDRARMNRRQNNPCTRASGNGTTIGSVQDFTLFCNTNLDGDVVERLDAFDLTACMDLCSSFHPRCDGASYDGTRCFLKTRLAPVDPRQFVRGIDSGIASFPEASSNCPALPGTQVALGTNFQVMCGFIIAGSDMSQNFAPTFQDCLGQCAATSGCAAVSYDPTLNLGFKNCYLKTGVADPGDLAADRRTDSARVLAAADPNQPPPGPGVSTIPVPPGGAANGNGVVFFTPPANPSITPSSIELPPAATTTALPGEATTAVSDISSTTETLAPPPAFPFPAPSASPDQFPDTFSGGANDPSIDPPSSNAWIAAPVVGSVAAIALIVISFIMLKRRRQSSPSSSPTEPRRDISRPSPISGLFTAWLPSRWSSSPVPRVPPLPVGIGNSNVSRSSTVGSSGRRMGNFSEVNTGERRNSVRNSVLGMVGDRDRRGMERLGDIEEGEMGRGEKEGERGGVKVYEVRNGRAELRELRSSLNGLGQNRWS